VRFEDLHSLIARLEADEGLYLPAQLRNRIEALDHLDAHLGGDTETGFRPRSEGAGILERAATLRVRLEAANAEVYRAIREAIRGGNADSLRDRISLYRDPQQKTAPGLGYDYFDEFIAGVLQIREPPNGPILSGPEQVFYQPTPVRHALTMVDRSGLSADGVLFDIGSGLGQFCIVASILTGARAIGVEIESSYVESARECVRNLRLNRVTFLQADAREADFSSGTVFHLYTPFTGSILRTVLNRLQEESAKRPITICTLGPCTDVVAREPWLSADTKPDTDLVTVFRP
jgi:hypothetical protein